MPTRYLKPGIRDSESIDRLSPLAEVLYYRLLVTVDDFGRFDARPSMVKSSCFPVRESMTVSKCADLLAELAKNGNIQVYEVDGKPYMQVCKWDNVPRSKESKFPAPADACIQVRASADDAHTLLPGTGTGTDNRKPEPKTKTEAGKLPTPDGVSDSVWTDFLRIRKAKRAPMTDTALDGIRHEADKAGLTLQEALQMCCARGWQGFKADWLAEQKRGVSQTIASQRLQQAQDFAPGIAASSMTYIDEVKNVTPIASR
jgi:hypothetical protein